MCKQDINIGRQTIVNQSTTAPVGGAIGLLFPPRADRLAVSVAIAPSAFASENESVRIGFRLTGDVASVWTLSKFSPSAVLRVEDFGQFITGEIMCWNLTTGGPAPTAFEFYLNVSLDGIL